MVIKVRNLTVKRPLFFRDLTTDIRVFGHNSTLVQILSGNSVGVRKRLDKIKKSLYLYGHVSN